MHGFPNRRWRWQRLRAGAALALLAIAGLALMWQTATRAGQSACTVTALAVFPADNKCQVAVFLTQAGQKPLTGTLRVELLDAAGKVQSEDTIQVRQKDNSGSYPFTYNISKDKSDKLSLRTQFQGDSKTFPLRDITLAKGHETTLTTSQQFVAGSPAALQCQVHGVQSLTDTVPLPAASVEIRLKNDKQEAQVLYKGTTDSRGQVLAHFHLPEAADGQYTLEVATKSALGEETLTQNVRVRDDAKILLVTDKPLYQPGQEIHIRALALRPFDLKPVAQQDILFEVEDGKGNKVFKRTFKTSDFGVASVDFQLADEVNMGTYQIRAALGQHQANKTVTVKQYQLPKFKVNVTADKSFYLPRETIHAELQADYFFGKPVSQARVKVEASTFDVAFKQFTTWEGTTDDNGHVKFDIPLPDYFVGQPLQKGNALVKLEVKLIDSADHKETVVKNYTVSDQPIQISLIPEGGKLAPKMENRIFAAAIYPDGSPAQAEVKLWLGKEAKGAPVATVQTNRAGLAEFKITPKEDQLRAGNHEQRKIEFLGGEQVGFGPQILLDVAAVAKDAKGNQATATVALNAHLLGENVLLRLDKAIYQAGDSLQADIRTSAGLPTAYLDVIREGQTVLTRWLEVQDGQAEYKLDLPPELFGSLEVHAYQLLNSGEIIRDSRVVYVQPRNDLHIKVEPNKKVHTPGESGRIRFLVTDSSGKPTAAALGVIVVDEAVYALQEMQPGLEKVYFTLQEELLKPQVQIKLPTDNIAPLVQQQVLPPGQQQIARALLTAVAVKAPACWQVAPVFQRQQQMQDKIQQIGWALWNASWNNQAVLEYNRATKEWRFKDNILEQLVAKKQYLVPQALEGPFGQKMTIQDVQKQEKDFKAENLAQAISGNKLQTVTWWVVHYTNQNKAKYFKNNAWDLPPSVVADAIKRFNGNNPDWSKDVWSHPYQLVARSKDHKNSTGQPQLNDYEIVSIGPDGKLGTKDDLHWPNANHWAYGNFWWGDSDKLAERMPRPGAFFGHGGGRQMFFRDEVRRKAMAADGVVREAAAMPMAAMADGAPLAKLKTGAAGSKSGGGGGGPAPPRIREYFPETMLWQPALITDENGEANLAINFADSITTWRLSASASSKGGALGGTTVPLKVFQEFFVDLDLPLNLTQSDEVAFPVAVYNYLDSPQTVKLELKQADWFALVDDRGLVRNLDLKPNEVTSVYFRIRANRIGNHPLTVMAYGSKKSDAIRRVVEVVPNGQKKETVVSDRLSGKVTQTITIPQNSIPDSYKLLVRVYPGVVAQVMEGMEGMLRLPGG